MPKYLITKDFIKDHEGGPIKSGDSLLSPNIFAQLAESEPDDAETKAEKNADKKKLLKETKMLAKIGLKDDRKKVAKK